MHHNKLKLMCMLILYKYENSVPNCNDLSVKCAKKIIVKTAISHTAKKCAKCEVYKKTRKKTKKITLKLCSLVSRDWLAIYVGVKITFFSIYPWCNIRNGF